MTKYNHKNHIAYRKVIEMFYNAITYRASYTEDKAEYVSLNDCLIIDYDEFKSILKDSKFCWCNLGRHLSLNLENIHTIRIY